MSEELRPCPRCGDEAHVVTEDGEVSMFLCEACGYWSDVSEFERIEDAFKWWNTRPIEDALRARITELEKVRRWIPVSERLPEAYTRVLACSESGYMEVDYRIHFCRVDVGIAEFYSLDNVTHWMPLPPNPEVQE